MLKTWQAGVLSLRQAAWQVRLQVTARRQATLEADRNPDVEIGVDTSQASHVTVGDISRFDCEHISNA